MHVDVSDILQEGEGSQAEFEVEGEQPQLEGIALTQPIQGTIRVLGTKGGVMVAGDLAAEVELECDRCLCAFNHRVEFPLDAEFSLDPEDDQFPIDKHGRVDLSEPVRQEIEIHLPLARLCQEDCAGIELKQKD